MTAGTTVKSKYALKVAGVQVPPVQRRPVKPTCSGCGRTFHRHVHGFPLAASVLVCGGCVPRRRAA